MEYKDFREIIKKYNMEFNEDLENIELEDTEIIWIFEYYSIFLHRDYMNLIKFLK